ncbi:hypothetical protein INT45_002643, partial [Circinella minor]
MSQQNNKTVDDNSYISPMLAQGTNSLSYKPRLIDFNGYEGEDFRHFQDTLESYFALADVKSDERKAKILLTQVKRYARTFLYNEIEGKNQLLTNYAGLIKLLKNEYITTDVIEYYKDAFEQITQGDDEPPRMFLGRIQQAADLAELGDQGKGLIQAKFKSGLLPQIKKHCYTMGAQTYDEYKQYAYGYWRGNHGTTLYPQDNPFIPKKAEDRIPRNWHNSYPPPPKSVLKTAKQYAFHSPDLNKEPDSPVDSLTRKMENLELYQHESPPYSNNYPSRNEDSLESIIRRLIQEETQKYTGYRQNRQNQYNNRGRNNNYNNNYNGSNNYSRNQNKKPSYSYQPRYNRQENKNTDTYHNTVRNQNQNRNYTPQRINNIGDNNNPRARPNSPSGTLAALLEEAECEQNTLEENDYEHINHEDADEAKLEERKDWDNIFEIESYHSSEFDDDNDNECIDDFNNFDDELFAARQSTRELRPRNEGGKVNKNKNITNKRVEFKDPPVRRKRKQKATRIPLPVSSPDVTQVPTQPAPTAHEVPMENLSHQPPSPLQNSPTIDLPEKEKEKEKETGLQSVFGKTAFSKEKTPPFVKPTQPPPLKGKQWSNFRTDFEKMDLDSPPVISSPKEESTRSTFKQNKKTPQPKNTTIKKNQLKTQAKPKTKASKMPSKRKTTAVSRAPPLLKRMPYNISTDILNRTADISFGQLLALVPSLRRQFTGA